MKSWRSAGVDSVVSLLTPDEAEDVDLQEEALYCRCAGLEFVSYRSRTALCRHPIPAQQNSQTDWTTTSRAVKGSSYIAGRASGAPD